VCLAPDNLVQDIRAAVAADYPARSGMSCVFVYICYRHSTHTYTHPCIYAAHCTLFIYHTYHYICTLRTILGAPGPCTQHSVCMCLNRGRFSHMPRLTYADVWTYAQEACKQHSTFAAPAAARASSIDRACDTYHNVHRIAEFRRMC
jgi:hypothetical protein